MQIFVINGNAKCGKTTFGEYVGDLLKSKNIPFLHGSSIDPVKKYLKEEGWKGQKWDGITKDAFWREAMYDYKCIMLYTDEHFFDRYALSLLWELTREDSEESLREDSRAVLFFDIREPENIQQLVDFIKEVRSIHIEIKTVFIDRRTDEIFNNYADTNQGNMKYDIVVDNNGDLGDLEENARQFAEEYIIEHEEQKRELENKA